MKNYIVRLDGVSLEVIRDTMRTECERYARIIDNLMSNPNVDQEHLQECKGMYELCAEALYKLLNHAF